MTPTTRNIYTRSVFATFSFNFGLPTYFVSHCCKEEFFKKSRVELFDCGAAKDMSKVTHVGVHHVDTMFLFCSVQSVQFALDHLKINFA